MKTLLALAFVAAAFNTGPAADAPSAWPQFRGPNGSGLAEGQYPPVEFGPEKNVRWKVPVPSGMSSPIVAGDLLVITAFEDDKLLTVAYDRATGKEAWRADAKAKEIEKFHKSMGSPAASTPATDGQRIVSYFGSCGLICYDLAGKELWRYELPTANVPGNFGSGVSPIIVDGVVVLVRDQVQDAKIIALDAADGSLKWEMPRQSPRAYSTPVAWDTPDGKQIVAAGHARMIGYDLATGKQQWRLDAVPSGCCSSPVTADGVLYFAGTGGEPGDVEAQLPKFAAMLEKFDTDKDGALTREEADKGLGGFFDIQDANKDGKLTEEEWGLLIKFLEEGKNGAFALEAGEKGELDESHLVWKQTKGLSYVPSAIVYQGQYVMVGDGGLVTAYDAASGDEIFQDRAAAGGSYYASPVAAGGHIYFTSLDGAITVLKAASDEPVVVAKNEKLDERAAATPAIADDSLYLRTDKHLWAFGEGKE